MTIPINQINQSKNLINSGDSLAEGIRILSDLTRKDIEKSYKIENTNNTEAYYSNRYGWTLRRILE